MLCNDDRVVLVTGASGFVAEHLIPDLKEVRLYRGRARS